MTCPSCTQGSIVELDGGVAPCGCYYRPGAAIPCSTVPGGSPDRCDAGCVSRERDLREQLSALTVEAARSLAGWHDAAEAVNHNADLYDKLTSVACAWAFDLTATQSVTPACSWCGARGEPGDRAASFAWGANHDAVCPAHPMRKVEADLRAALATSDAHRVERDAARCDAKLARATLATMTEQREQWFAEVEARTWVNEWKENPARVLYEEGQRDLAAAREALRQAQVHLRGRCACPGAVGCKDRIDTIVAAALSPAPQAGAGKAVGNGR